MLIERLQVKGLLSFGPEGIDLTLEPLNVLIGPNGSGKSNLLQVLALLRTTTGADSSLSRTEWKDLLWQGPPYPDENADAEASIVTTVRMPPTDKIAGSLVHCISLFTYDDDSLAESIGLVDKSGHIDLLDEFDDDDECGPNWEDCLGALLRWYSRMRFYRDWTFGALAPSRRGHSGSSDTDTLSENADNLAAVLSRFASGRRERLAKYLGRFYAGIVDVHTPVHDGKASVVVEEKSGRLIPAARLSDGTLRYLSLLTILLDPDPPPLIAIEEPELGLHPDIVFDLARLLVDVSQRTQLILTTHSPTLIDALTDYPSSVVVCDKYDGQTRFKRLDPEALEAWKDEPGLGDVWCAGGIGGNPW